MTVYFIGAGPGDPELLTLKAQRLIAACPVCLYAGSLVPEQVVAGAPEVGPANGSLVIVGGAMRSAEIYERFIELAGGPDAHIVLVPTAGGAEEYDEFWQGMNAWREHGARNLTLLHTIDPAEADTDAFVEPLKSAAGVFFFGGRQWRLVDAYGDTKAEEAFREVLERGGVIGGWVCVRRSSDAVPRSRCWTVSIQVKSPTRRWPC